MKYKVGIYLRLSQEDKIKLDDSESIKNQRNMLIDYINKNKELILYDIYCDEDLSGAGVYRPEFERMINDCKNGKIDIVLCKSQSRFSRDMEVIEKYINNKFLEWNVRFIGLCDNADTNNIGNKKSRQINGLVNEWFLEDTSNNIRGAFYSKMRLGEYISPFTVYGYKIDKNDNNKIVIDNNVSYVVKKIYNLYLCGYGYGKISKYLNDNNIDSPSLYKYKCGIKLNVVSNKSRDMIKWSSNSVKKILTNEIYIGNLVQGKRTTVSYKNHHIINKNRNEWIRCNNTHEGIIDRDTFYMVQELIRKRSRVIKREDNIHIFSSLVYCKRCGGILRRKKGSRYYYLVCSNSERGICSNNKSVRYDVLEKMLLDLINGKISKKMDIDYLCNRLCNRNSVSKGDSLQKERKDILSKISINDRYLDSIYKDKLDGVIENVEFKKLISKYRNEYKKLNSMLDSVNERIRYYNNYDVVSIVSKYKKLDKLNRLIVTSFISRIDIDEVYDKKRDIYVMWVDK